MISDKRIYSFADYLNWDIAYTTGLELIDGARIRKKRMSAEQRLVVIGLFRYLENFSQEHPCWVLPAPCTVRPFEQEGDSPEDIYTVLQPDLTVICDKSKLDNHGCKGAPDLVIEVFSPSTACHNQLAKYDLYRQAGVREYWIVSPKEKRVQVFVREGAKLVLWEMYKKHDIAKAHILEGCFIELEKVFAE